MRHTVSLKKNHEFRSLYARGKKTVGVYFAMYARKNRAGINRLGVAVSSKLGGAVVRNRVRRRISEAYRTNEGLFMRGFDLVIAARTKAVGAEFTVLRNELLRHGRKLGVCAPLSDKDGISEERERDKKP